MVLRSYGALVSQGGLDSGVCWFWTATSEMEVQQATTLVLSTVSIVKGRRTHRGNSLLGASMRTWSSLIKLRSEWDHIGIWDTGCRLDESWLGRHMLAMLVAGHSPIHTKAVSNLWEAGGPSGCSLPGKWITDSIELNIHALCVCHHAFTGPFPLCHTQALGNA